MVIIKELIKTPKNTPITVCILLILNILAATHPVHAPVTGNGMPIKIIKPNNFNLSIIAPFFSDRLKSHLKKISI